MMSDVRGKICKCNTKKIRDFSILFRKNILRFAQNCVNLPSRYQVTSVLGRAAESTDMDELLEPDMFSPEVASASELTGVLDES